MPKQTVEVVLNAMYVARDMRYCVVFADGGVVNDLVTISGLLHWPWNSCLPNADCCVRVMIDGAGKRILCKKGTSVPAPFRISQGTRAAALLPEFALFRMIVVVLNRVHLHFDVVLIV